MLPLWLITLWVFCADCSPGWVNRTVEHVEKCCLVSEIKNEATCRGTSQLADLQSTNHFVSSLALYNWTNNIFDPDVLLPFPNLKNFTICRSAVRLIDKPFAGVLLLQVLNITYNDIESIKPSIFLNLENLKIIDLRYNKLHQFDPSSLTILPNFQAIYLVGNQWHCHLDFSWIVISNVSILQYVHDLDSMLCRGPMYNGKPLRQVIIILKNLETECLAMGNNCTCKLEHVIRISTNLRPMITVNCTKLNLTDLPVELPTFTSTLILRENKISNLKEFIQNEKYFQLFNVYLEYNEISSIDILEGSPWLLNVRALNLKGNNLSEIPFFILEHAIDANYNILHLFLSENPWKCDCRFIKSFKDFLMKYRQIIKDVGAIQCTYTEDGQPSNVTCNLEVNKVERYKHMRKMMNYHPSNNFKYYVQLILGLSSNRVCHESTPSRFSFLRILNYIMVTILIFLFADFLYNYYKYKRYHKLPWIVS